MVRLEIDVLSNQEKERARGGGVEVARRRKMLRRSVTSTATKRERNKERTVAKGI